MSGIPDVRLDHRVAGDLRRRDSVAAVVDVEHVTGPDQPYRRRLTSLLEPCSVELDLRPVEVTGAEADVCERDPCRCERRMCDTPPFSRSSRVRTGGVEPPQPLATRLQRAELADARRPRDRAAGRARTDTAGITTPDACLYITAATAPKKGLVGGTMGSPDGRNGRRDWLPATGGRDVARSNGSGAGCFTFQQSCQRDYHAATPSPVGPGGLSAQPHVGARALRSPVPSLPRPARRRVDPSKMARVGFEPTVSSS
jgi:hypothetical protein